MNVTALAGGVGGAKLCVGLQAALPPGQLSAIVNTGDDAIVYGVHVSPDVDIVTYWLAGVADTDRGWGIAGDGFTVVDALGALGRATWFRLGDQDLATCLLRTERMGAGEALSSVTDSIRRALGVPTRVIPMSDDPVRTHVRCANGRTLAFQEYFVRERTRPEVVGLRYEGAEAAKPAPGVLEAIAASDVVVICPSNPYLSIAPILGLPGVRDALEVHESVVAVTPIVRGAALKGPADRLLASLGGRASASGVARLYHGVADVFVVDSSDPSEIEEVAGSGTRAVGLDTVMRTEADSGRLAREILRL